MSAIYGVLLAILNLSNATKNQKDAFSSFMQSYFSKLHNALYYLFAAFYLCETDTLKMAMGAFGTLLLINSLMGLQILYKLFSKRSSNQIVLENLVESPEAHLVSEKEYNNRLPRVLESNELTTKMFSEGWKFNLFQDCDSATRQILGIAIIFALTYFSLVQVVMT